MEDAWVSIANLPVIDQDLAAVPNAFIALNQERHTCVLFITPYPDVSAFQISSVGAQNRQRSCPFTAAHVGGLDARPTFTCCSAAAMASR